MHSERDFKGQDRRMIRRRSLLSSSMLGLVAVLGILLLFGCTGLSAGGYTPVGFEDQQGWKLVFDDEFDGEELDSDKWVTCYWWDDDGCTNRGNNELQWYRPNNVLVRDGVLTLRARERRIEANDGNTYDYTSGMVTTGRLVDDMDEPTRFTFQYGFAEIRAWVPAGQGIWPAFWMLPDDHTSKPEIDVLEILGDEPDIIHMSIHYLDDNGDRQRVNLDWEGPDFSQDWHVYGVDWQEDVIIWYIDGVERWRYEGTQDMLTKQMYLLLNLAVGGDWPGSPDSDTEFPADYQIDYVRVWQRTTEDS